MDTLGRKMRIKNPLILWILPVKLFFFIAVSLICLSHQIMAQPEIDFKQFSNKYAFDPIIMVDKQGILSRGLFLDMVGDSLKLLLNSKVQMVAINSIKFFKINAERSNRENMVNLGIAGAFGFQLLLRKDPWQSDRFIQSDGLWTHFLVGVLGAVGGGLVGLGIDLAGEKKEMEYDLENPKDVQKMVRDISSTNRKKNLHFYYEMSKVYSRTDPNLKQSTGYYSNYENSSLNVFRSIRVTYDIKDNVEGGIAIYSVAEPNIKFSFYSQNIYGNEEMANTVYGYYAAVYYNLLGDPMDRDICLKAGFGAGFAKIDYTITKSKSIYDPAKGLTVTTSDATNFNKTTVSMLASIEARVYPTSGVSIALTGDYIYIPEKTISSGIPGEADKSFGNFSLGLTLGFHF